MTEQLTDEQLADANNVLHQALNHWSHRVDAVLSRQEMERITYADIGGIIGGCTGAQ
jgi:hypothetical protein